ncbi:GNAT family N-acetyltransferase [Dictyobacter kobayashii]|uniref:N-acetyltransferase domain-containing protein n=1 Tax=Dictyobacter kobayashii TaxID=2014872 RepID=A0A402AL12_9CHLR|nr:hypothetical protein [Dictyobacter kobayashii]GCE19817.1 hypothetical protein KDK_36170 [Dictyobacter kobayashii]
MLFLTEPSAQYKESFLEGLKEFQQEGTLLQYNLPRLTADFDGYLQHVNRVYNRTSLPPDFVPDTRYWLIEGDGQDGVYVGNLTVRHELNAFLLKVGGHIGYQIRPSWRRRDMAGRYCSWVYRRHWL